MIATAKPNTKVLLAETSGSPALSVLDFETWGAAAKELGVTLIVDNTLATPYLCKPLEHGASAVMHSITEYSNATPPVCGALWWTAAISTGLPVANTPA